MTKWPPRNATSSISSFPHPNSSTTYNITSREKYSRRKSKSRIFTQELKIIESNWWETPKYLPWEKGETWRQGHARRSRIKASLLICRRKMTIRLLGWHLTSLLNVLKLKLWKTNSNMIGKQYQTTYNIIYKFSFILVFFLVLATRCGGRENKRSKLSVTKGGTKKKLINLC